MNLTRHDIIEKQKADKQN